MDSEKKQALRDALALLRDHVDQDPEASLREQLDVLYSELEGMAKLVPAELRWTMECNGGCGQNVVPLRRTVVPLLSPDGAEWLGWHCPVCRRRYTGDVPLDGKWLSHVMQQTGGE